MKLRFEIGLKLLRSSVDRDGFLRRGWTRACLNDDGKIIHIKYFRRYVTLGRPPPPPVTKCHTRPTPPPPPGALRNS